MNFFTRKLFFPLAFLFTMLSLANASVEASDPIPSDVIVGSWETYDDDTHLLTSIVRIVRVADRVDKADGQGRPQYEGYVERIFPQANEDPHPRCTKCADARKNQPVLGMRIISHLRFSSPDHYDDGDILDPDNGEIYRLRVTIIEHNTKLEARGYFGISLFGRSQIWRRVVGAPATQKGPKDLHVGANAGPSVAPSAVSDAVSKTTETPH